jgi:hypothetical protein
LLLHGRRKQWPSRNDNNEQSEWYPACGILKKGGSEKLRKLGAGIRRQQDFPDIGKIERESFQTLETHPEVALHLCDFCALLRQIIFSVLGGGLVVIFVNSGAFCGKTSSGQRDTCFTFCGSVGDVALPIAEKSGAYEAPHSKTFTLPRRGG